MEEMRVIISDTQPTYFFIIESSKVIGACINKKDEKHKYELLKRFYEENKEQVQSWKNK